MLTLQRLLGLLDRGCAVLSIKLSIGGAAFSANEEACIGSCSSVFLRGAVSAPQASKTIQTKGRRGRDCAPFKEAEEEPARVLSRALVTHRSVRGGVGVGEANKGRGFEEYDVGEVVPGVRVLLQAVAARLSSDGEERPQLAQETASHAAAARPAVQPQDNRSRRLVLLGLDEHVEQLPASILVNVDVPWKRTAREGDAMVAEQAFG